MCRETDQVRAMKLQIDLARELEKPLVLHVRDADDIAFKVLQQVWLTASIDPLNSCPS